MRPCLYSPCVLRMDASWLCWLMRQDLTAGMYARWVMKLSEYKFEIQHATVPAADALSRNPPVLNPLEDDTDDSTMTSAGDSDSHVNVLIAHPADAATLSNIPTVFATTKPPPSIMLDDPTLEDIMIAQQHDPGIARFTYDLKQGKSTTSKQGTYYLQGDVLHHQQAGVTGLHQQLVIPTVYQNLFLRRFHRSPISGHLGARKTLSTLKRQCFWPTMNKDTKSFTDVCHECQKAKATQHARYGSLHPITYKEVMEVLSVDVVGPFSPSTKDGNTVIFTIIDNFSNYIWAVAAKDQTSSTTAKLLYDTVFVKHGYPKQLLSDRGSNFLSETVQEITKLLKIKQTVTSAWHPQTNGKNERSHKLLLSQIRIFVNDNKSDWES